jgi:hypothetical protein
MRNVVLGLCASVSASCFFASFVPSTGFAMGHGSQIQLHHFVQKPQKVFVSLVESQKSPSTFLGKWTAPKGFEIVVTTRALPNAASYVEHVWKPGVLLAALETQPKMVNTSHTSKAIFAFETMSIVEIMPKEYLSIASNPLEFIDLAANFETKTSEVVKAKTKPLSNSQNFSVKNAVVLEPQADRLVESIRQLSGEEEVDVAGSVIRIPDRGSAGGRKSTHEFLQDKFAKIGLKSELKCYEYRNFKGCNIEATLEGVNTNKVVLVTAHIDSVNNKGADDDASGTAAILETARLLSEVKPQFSVKFVGFDQEEVGLIGSKAYAKELTASEKAKIAGVFQMDMVGYDSNKDGVIHAMDCGRADSIPITSVIKAQVAALRLPLKIADACTNRSDHASFWNEKVPATIVSENFFGDRTTSPDSNKCYHRKCDTIELVDMNYALNITKLVANSVFVFGNL